MTTLTVIQEKDELGAEFRDSFARLTEHAPFPWQEALYSEFLDGPPFRPVCDLPTGLGKTSVVAIWLLALAHRARTERLAGFPRRLVYVVNRRTVVDQATYEAQNLRLALERPGLAALREILVALCVRPNSAPLAISTLRGEFADNAEWRDDPARAAIIVGTVDMIGSRLLFSGYGRGFKSRPLHAGFLGQQALLVHDEAHLEPAFQELLQTIVTEQQAEFAKLHVMALTATTRATVATPLLGDRDRDDPEVRKRLAARKAVALHSVEAENLADEITKHALEYRDHDQAILIFLRKLEDVYKVRDKLRKAGLSHQTQTLTGTMRGKERDQLAANDPIFARFVRGSKVTPQPASVYLICTSAGEVGIDMSADHLVCDLTPFDSVAQRFGRVNRFGKRDAKIDIVYAAPAAEGSGRAKRGANPASDAYEQARTATLQLLQRLPRDASGRYNASPAALAELPAADRILAFTPAPTILPGTDILFDAWALTSVRERLPGRPAVVDWLHGVAGWEPPETHVAWREEVELINGELAERYPPEELLEDYPVKPHELLRDRYDRVFDELRQLTQRSPAIPAWLVDDHAVELTTLEKLLARGPDAIAHKTVLLPPSAGGLECRDEHQATGLLDGKSEYRAAARELYDIADEWLDTDGQPRRCRLWDDAELADKSMRLVAPVIDTRPGDEPDEDEQADAAAKRRFWRWYARPRSADDDGSRTAGEPQALQPHLRCAGDFADVIVAKLALAEPEATAVRLAARWHDLGKNRGNWQRAIGNRDYPQTVLAKSGGQMRPRDLNKYRHEFGSLIDVFRQPEFPALDEATRDLVLHLIAAHHGRARPHFPAEEILDPERQQELVAATVRAVAPRFARLQRKYGRWGLAYLESLLRAADIMASQEKLSETPAAQPPSSTSGAL